ncbi:MAG: UbiA family prenyltransferase [Candidatus Paceibacterota bacterium]
MITFIEKVITVIEAKYVSALGWIATFASFVIIRNILEGISSGSGSFLSQKNFEFFFLHSFTFYLASFLGLILIINLITKDHIKKTILFVLFLIPIIITPPLADLAATGGNQTLMTYRQIPPGTNNLIEMSQYFFNYILHGPNGILFFGESTSLSQVYINYGIRIEIAILIFILLLYTYVKTKSVTKLLWSFLLLQLGLFLMGHFPYIINLIFGKGSGILSRGDTIMSLLYLFVSTLFAGIIFYLYDKKKTWSVIKNFRITRTLNTTILLFIGIILGIKNVDQYVSINWELIFFILAACLSNIFCWGWGVSYNDRKDEKIDIISNTNRPLPSKTLSLEENNFTSKLFLGLSYLYGFIVGYAFFVMILIKSSLGYLYSSDFFHLKKYPILSQFVIACAYLTTIMAGFLLISGNLISDFPVKLSLSVLVLFTLGVGFKDIKDYQGDKNQNIRTLPVIFGLERGKKIIGAMGTLAFILIPLIFNQYFYLLIIPSIICAILYFYFTNKENYKELPVFMTYFLLLFL